MNYPNTSLLASTEDSWLWQVSERPQTRCLRHPSLPPRTSTHYTRCTSMTYLTGRGVSGNARGTVELGQADAAPAPGLHRLQHTQGPDLHLVLDGQRHQELHLHGRQDRLAGRDPPAVAVLLDAGDTPPIPAVYP